MSFWSLSRRKYLIRPSFQLRLALNIFFFIVIYSIIIGCLLFLPLFLESKAATTFEEQVRISEITLYLHARLWIAVFLVAAMAGIHAIFYSHRVVGPAYRFEAMLNELLNGNYSIRIKIRRKDEFKEIEVLLNRLAEVLERVRISDRQLRSDITDRLVSINAMVEASGIEHPEQVRHALKSMIGEIGIA
ncbi:MAG: methyl-accepting chemotaxis protein [Proteobacteria bacterium]|nr:methyl-accepting chemotaxis protein [Pseudomonadota bacterium]